MEYSYELKLPKDRIAVLIGKKGEVKKSIEEATETKITIDSKEGDVVISGCDAIKLYSAKELVRAIGRGFNPEVAQLLLKQDYCFESIKIDDFSNSKTQLPRLKGRVIGKDGKARRNIEELTDTNICVYGKTVGIIGTAENCSTARRAIESLLGGSMHATVYKWLAKKKREERLQ
ncbi:MAG: KH domain-containing protein [Candidatus Woesearchaeota archaeon]